MQDGKELFWSDMNPHFGVWRKPNAQFRHVKSCFTADYHTNDYGARDIQRSKASDRSRVIVLGDSFVEGYGVSREERLTDILQDKTQLPHLNFGASGSFGSTQEALVYEHLAGEFDHDMVLIGFLPDNDFDDDARQISGRYIPYWKGEYPDYTLTYTQPNVTDSDFTEENYTPSLVQLFWHNYFHLPNVIDYLSAAWEYRKKLNRASDENYLDEKSRFVRFNKNEFNRLIYSYEKIIASAPNKKIIIFSIPRIYDLERYEKTATSPLGEELRTWSTSYDQVQFIDLLPLMSTCLTNEAIEPITLFHTCDGHWNARGHRLAADILFDEISYQRPLVDSLK